MWTALGVRTERSVAEKRLGNQDCVLATSTDSCSVIAVADGHGSTASIRSAVGAQLACQALADIARDLQQYLDSADTASGRARRSTILDRPLSKDLLRTWERRVAQHFVDVPPRPYELHELQLTMASWDKKFTDPTGSPNLSQVKILYGSTLLGVYATPTEIVAWQLGDGLTRVVDDSMRVHSPYPDTNQLMGEVTESLGTEGAERLIEHKVWWRESAQWPYLIAICSDGLEKAYADLGAFDAWVSKTAERTRELQLNGAASASIEAEIESRLVELVEEGKRYSGDDASLSVVFRTPTQPERTGHDVAGG